MPCPCLGADDGTDKNAELALSTQQTQPQEEQLAPAVTDDSDLRRAPSSNKKSRGSRGSDSSNKEPFNPMDYEDGGVDGLSKLSNKSDSHRSLEKPIEKSISENKSQISGRLSTISMMGEDLLNLSYDALSELATELWRQATQYLMPDEAAEANEIHAEEIKHMDKEQLREHVVANRDISNAVQEIVDSGEATGDEVASAQRSSLNLGGSELFNGDQFAMILRRSINPDNTINAELFLKASRQLPGLVGGLGRTFEFATADIEKKMEIAEERLTETADDLGMSKSQVTLEDMVERDIRLGVTHDGKKAAPASRTLLRLLWFFDFTAALLQGTADAQDEDLSTICSNAYEEALAPRHPWILRKAARSGMRLLPNKRVFRVRLGTADLPRDVEQARITGWADEVRAVKAIMWDYMEDKGLEELP